MQIDLDACPFCPTGEARLLAWEVGASDSYSAAVECLCCGARIERDDQPSREAATDAVRAAWNRRATDGQRDTARGVPEVTEEWCRNLAAKGYGSGYRMERTVLKHCRRMIEEVLAAAPTPCAACPAPVDATEAAEREHMGCAHCGTGIYAPPTPPDGGHTVRRWGFCSTCRHSTIPGEACGRTDCPDGDAETVQPFKAGDIVRERTVYGYSDDARVLRAAPNGGLLVECIKTGTRYGWTAARCEPVAASKGARDV